MSHHINKEYDLYSIRCFVIYAKDMYRNKYGEDPTDVYFTDNEYKILNKYNVMDTGIALFNEIKQKGIKEYFPKFIGLTTHWDSDKFYIKGDKDKYNLNWEDTAREWAIR